MPTEPDTPADPPETQPPRGPAAVFDAARFRREARLVVDWIADYWQSLADRPVQSQVEPGWVRSRLPAQPPTGAESIDAVLDDLDRVIVPGLTHWQHPRFFGYFPVGASAASMLGELLSAGLGVQGMLWSTSPACTELETHVLDWLRVLIGLPERFASLGRGGGVIQDSASSGLLCVAVAARDRARAALGDGDRRPLTAYASAAAHSSFEKGLRIAGIGREQLRRIPVDDRGRMDADALSAALDADAAAGAIPFFVTATVGTTACGAFDPVPAIATAARWHGAWLHVDAAWAGAAALCEEFRDAVVAGAESANSWGFNPHKWLPVNFDCHALWVADRGPLLASLSMKPDYLRNAASDSGAVVDYSDWQVPLGRRFRALKLWLTLRLIGAEALRQRIRDHVAWAEEFAGWVGADPRFELVGRPSLSLVCFRLRAGNEATRDLLSRVNASGKAFLSPAEVSGSLAIRLAVGGAQTRRDDVETAWKQLAELA